MSATKLTGHFATAAGVDDLGGSGGGALVVDGPLGDVEVPELLPNVVVEIAETRTGGSGSAGPIRSAADVVVDRRELDLVVATIDRNPQAATALAVLLRGGERRSVADGLHAESAVYGVLQAGAEFSRWRGSREARTRPHPAGPVLLAERREDVLDVVLNRPEVRNALDARLRDELADALRLALDDPTLRVELSGAGASYSSGGDLDEFGSRSDPASAHLVRLSRSLGWMIHQLRDRIHVTVHGPTAGSGVELPAFAGRVTARRDTTFALPEVGLGLIPGAGGTVSLARRIGRHRTALLALLGHSIDAPTALRWGLVDAVVDAE